MNLSLGDIVTFNYASGIKSGRIIDIAENINAINLSIYCTDSTGSYKVTIPHYSVIDKRGGIMEEIKKPSRYNKRGSLECWDVILDQEMNFLEGNVLKYIWRYKEKNGIEDLKKARVYLDKLILESEKK
jgi:hypothetical protein